MFPLRAILLRAILAAFVLGLGFAPDRASADLDPEAALALVRAQWFEGIPQERIEPLSPDAQTALGELLEDPDAAEHHSAAIEVLGLAGGRGAFPLVMGYERRAAGKTSDDTELSSSVHRARIAVPIALGHLARRDDRALRQLLREADRTNGPRWRTQRLDADRVARVQREMCAIGLGLSGREDAAHALRRMRGAGGAEAWQRHVAEALEMNRQNAARNGRAR